nr:MAG TPA: Protein of unknown function (DUF1043) [Caudoviricetes sp.]
MNIIIFVVAWIFGFGIGIIAGKNYAYKSMIEHVEQYYIRKEAEYQQWCVTYFQQMEDDYENKTRGANR